MNAGFRYSVIILGAVWISVVVVWRTGMRAIMRVLDFDVRITYYTDMSQQMDHNKFFRSISNIRPQSSRYMRNSEQSDNGMVVIIKTMQYLLEIIQQRVHSRG